MQQSARVVQSLEDLVGVLEEWAHGGRVGAWLNAFSFVVELCVFIYTYISRIHVHTASECVIHPTNITTTEISSSSISLVCREAWMHC